MFAALCSSNTFGHTANGPQPSSLSILATPSESSALSSSESSTPATASKAHGPLISRSIPNANWAQLFSINWNEMPEDLMVAVRAKQVPLPKLRHAMVRRVVQQIVKITNKPGRLNLTTIAAK